MYNDIGGYSCYDRIGLERQKKSPVNSFRNPNSNAEKPIISKTLRWNIEEQKENISFPKTLKYNTYSKCNQDTQTAEQQINYLSYKKEKKKEQKDYSNTFGSKSYSTIKFYNSLEHDYDFSKSHGQYQKDFKSQEPKSKDIKTLIMSLNYNSNLKDLIIPSFRHKQIRLEDQDNQIFKKKMKSCRSQKKIENSWNKSYLTTDQPDIKKQLTCSKSYKKLVKFADEQTYPQPFQFKRLPPFCYQKNEKSLKDVSKINNFKTSCYKPKTESQLLQEKQIKNIKTDNSRLKGISKKHGLSITDFSLGSCKGKGAFGQVFPAMHKATRMLVAIKKVPKQKVKYIMDQFINEIKIQMFLDHPNIVKLYGFFDDLTHFYIVMEYMEGGSLFSYLKMKKKLTSDDTKTKLRQVCLGLKQMHDNSILHRDIKPQNIVITNDVCKLCDFGWSTVCKDRRTTYCGTLDYISPQIVGGQGYDDSVDIWCIGVLAYEMVCGKTPFYNISRAETMKKIMNVKYQYPPELTPKLKSFIDKILKKNPQDRLGIDKVLHDVFLTE